MKKNLIYIGGAVVVLIALILIYSNKNKEEVGTENLDGSSVTTPTTGEKPTNSSPTSPSSPSKTPATKTPNTIKPQLPKQPASTIPTISNLNGAIFKLTSYNGKPVDPNIKYTITFDKEAVYAKFCNQMSGNYVLDNGLIKAVNLLGTKMYCSTPENAMNIESSFASMFNSGARISYTESILIISNSENIMMFYGFIN